MNRKTLLISCIVGLLTFCMGWFLNDMKQFADGVVVDRIRIDSLQKLNQNWKTITQEQLDSLMILNNLKSKTSDFSSKISGRFILKGANSAGFDFINSSTVLWTNEIAPFQPDTLKIRWLDNSTFMTKSTERINLDCSPVVWIYQIISFDGQHLIVNNIWTGWNDYDDKQTEFIKAINEQ